MKNIKYLVVIIISIAVRFSTSDSLSSNNIPDDQASQTFTRETAVNLGADVSDDAVSLTLRKALINAILSDDVTLNQYSKSKGHVRFLNAFAKLYSLVTNNTLNPQENIIATLGGTEALNIAFQSLTEPGDEWIIIEPFYPKFRPQIEHIRGIIRYSNLKLNKTSGHIHGSDWQLDKAEFASLFNNKTRGVLLNNPNNPSGKLYTRNELQFIADLADKWDVVVISDEVHEWAVYESHEMVRFGTLPGMFDRTLTIGSASKTFQVAGWRIGWVYGPAHLISRLSYVHEFLVRNAPTPQQIAIAYAFEQEYKNYGKPHSHFQTNVRNAEGKRDILAQAFRDAGMVPVVPDGGYCMMATWPKFEKYRQEINQENGRDTSEQFTNWMIQNVGVLGHPISNFYGDEHRDHGEKYIRFCYHKNNKTLESATHNLLRLKKY